MVEVTLFQGVAVVVFASLTAVGWFLKIARDLEKEIETIVDNKSTIVDEYFFRSVSGVTSKIFLRLLKSYGQIETGQGTLIDAFKTQMGPYIDEIMKLSARQIEETIYTTPLPPQILDVCQITDEDKDQLFNISLLSSQLKERIPDVLSSLVDKMTKGIISGIVCGILIALLDLLVNLDLIQYFGIMSAFALLAGFVYINYGVLGIWAVRKTEKKLKKLKKAKDINSVWEIVAEVSKHK